MDPLRLYVVRRCMPCGPVGWHWEEAKHSEVGEVLEIHSSSLFNICLHLGRKMIAL